MALVSSGKPTIFRSSFEFLRLLLSLLSSNASFRRPRVPKVHGITYSTSFGLAVTLICKLSSGCNRAAYFDTKKNDGFFLYQSIFSKIHYKLEVYSDEFILLHSEIFLQAQSELYNNNYDFIN